MSIIGIDIGSSNTKIIEYKEKKILNSAIFPNENVEKLLEIFLEQNKIDIRKVQKVVTTGIGGKRVKDNKYNVPIENVDEFIAIGTGGLFLSQKEKAIIISVGTGTALIRAENKEFKHLGGTGIGAGTLTNLCDKFVGVKSFYEIMELSEQGDLDNIDLRISDLTDENIKSLPLELTLSNFGKLKENASKKDIVAGLVNMVFEVIGMMGAFASINDDIKDIVMIGNITCMHGVKDILRKIEKTHNVNFIIPENPQFVVIVGAIESLNKS